MDENEIVKERAKKVYGFLREKYLWVSYIALAILVYLSVRIRSSNLSGLKDITTGTWTLGPDLDPFLFLRWAKYIVANGSLFAWDNMRYFPIGFDTRAELILHPYMIAWFHKVATIFGSESVTHSAVLYPVFFFAITVIAFFFLVRKIFEDGFGKQAASIIALIGSFFLVVMPSLLPRTIAGIPEKESAAFFFLFLTFYLFLSAWKSKNLKYQILLAVSAGLSTAAMSLVWGGFTFIFVTLGTLMFAMFLFGQVDKEKLYAYGCWLISSSFVMSLFSTRYSIKNLLSSTTSLIAFSAFFVIVVHFIIFNTKLKKYFDKDKFSKVPKEIISIIVTIILGIVSSIVIFGFGFIWDKLRDVLSILITPVASRFGVTVAENRQPFFSEWSNSFGPIFYKIPLTFWLFFIGSIFLFYYLTKAFRKDERVVLTGSYFVFLAAIIFSRYSGDSILNGTGGMSLLVYFLGFVAFFGAVGYYYYKYHKQEELYKLKKIDVGLIMLFVMFFLSIIAARGSVRTIMLLVPSASMIIGYFAVVAVQNIKKSNDDLMKMISIVVAVLVVLATAYAAYGFYSGVSASAKGYVPSVYNQQWQKAMGWARESTPEDAVFGHWWDYGYWLQSIGERATVLDGGNAVGYWNHLMGRHALTGSDNRLALEFLYAHNTTHFLIDSTDIGKYGAFSSIGSDENFDRVSYIQTFQRNNDQTQELKNTTAFLYQGGWGLDEDIVYETNGTKIFLPSGKAALGAMIIEIENDGSITKPARGIFVYQGNQYQIPMRYGFDGEKFVDFGYGIDAGFFLFPRLSESQGGLQVEENGAAFYLSSRTVKSQLARLYLYGEENGNFVLAHTEDDFLVAQIKSQNPNFKGDFVFYDVLRGPIKIWEINYPRDIEFKEEFLETAYPDSLQTVR